MTTVDTASSPVRELRIEPPDLLVIARHPLGQDDKDRIAAALDPYAARIAVVDDGADEIAATLARLFPPGATAVLDGIGEVPVVVADQRGPAS